MRDRCPVAQAGQVFLALVGWRPSPGCTGSASPCACLTSRLESLKLEKPFQGPNLGYFQPTVPASERQGAAQHWDLHKQAPRLSALGSLTANGPLHQMGDPHLVHVFYSTPQGSLCQDTGYVIL